MPGPAFAGRALVLKTVPAGEVWRRMYETRFPDPLGWARLTFSMDDLITGQLSSLATPTWTGAPVCTTSR